MGDIDFPTLLGMELFRPDGAYIAKFVMQPQVVHDFSQFPASSVQLDRYNYWPEANSLTQDARERGANQIIGTAGSRAVTKEKVIVTLKEFTGPSSGDPNNPSSPGNLVIPVQDIVRAQRLLWDTGKIDMFHQSIGSDTLIQDYRRWKDRVYINLGLESAAIGEASDSQGGYANPLSVADGGTYATGPTKISTRDIMQIVTDMRKRHVPPFPSILGPVYHALSDSKFIQHLREDSDYREVAKYPGGIASSMLQPGMYPGSAPQMPSPGDWRGMPNTLVQSGGFYGQVGYQYGDFMPTGFVYEGVRYFDTTNLPTANVTFNYTAAAANSSAATGSAVRQCALSIMCGVQAVGEGIYGNGPEVRLNENSDYQRFINVIWCEFSGPTVLNRNFITVVRSPLN